MIWTYKQALERAQRGYNFLWLQGENFGLDLVRLREFRGHLDVSTYYQCPLALSGISSFHTASMRIQHQAGFSLKKLDEFVKSHGFDTERSPDWTPTWLVNREWRLLTKAWRQLLEPEITSRDTTAPAVDPLWAEFEATRSS
jgi:hypothetical protein